MDTLIVGEEPCTIANIVNIMSESSSFRTNWFRFARCLGVPEVRILKLKNDLRLGVSDFEDLLVHLLYIWKGRCGDDATLEVLCQSLTNSYSEDIADKLEDEFTEVLKTHILATGEVNVQGHVIKISDIFATTADFPPEIVKLLNRKDPIQILDEFQIPNRPTYYVQRSLSPRTRLNPDVFKSASSDVFVLENLDSGELDYKLFGSKVERSNTQTVRVTAKFILLDDAKDYERICNRVSSSNTPVHLVRFYNGSFYWLSSSGSLELIQQHVNPDEVHVSEEEFVAKYLSKIENVPVCIADALGMGKSLLLASIAQRVKETHTNRVVLFHALSKLRRLTKSQVVNLFWKQISPNTFANEALKRVIESGRIQLELFLDGFDEVLPNQLEPVKQLLKSLKKRKNIKIYVTTRPHMRNQLEETLGVLSFTILPFSEDNQLHFLTRFWESIGEELDDSQVKSFANLCLEMLKANMSEGIPLQCALLALSEGNGLSFDIFQKMVKGLGSENPALDLEPLVRNKFVNPREKKRWFIELFRNLYAHGGRIHNAAKKLEENKLELVEGIAINRQLLEQLKISTCIDEVVLDSIQTATDLYDRIIAEDITLEQVMLALLECNQLDAFDAIRESYLHVPERVNELSVRANGTAMKQIVAPEEATNIKWFGDILVNFSATLGKGSEGTVVYEGTFGKYDKPRRVAVKSVNVLLNEEADVETEINTLLECDAHKNIVKYYNYEKKQYDGRTTYYIALELSDITLKDWTMESERFKSKWNNEKGITPINAIKQISEGVEFLHNKGIIHRDLKPENVLLLKLSSSDISVKLSDFGISRIIPDGQTHKTIFTSSGTPGWMAPEILEGNRMTRKTDIFPLGCLFYYILTNGEHPFGSGSSRQFNIKDGKVSVDASKIKDSHNIGMVRLIRLMISTEPNQRPDITSIINHHCFWDCAKTLQFIVDVSNAKCDDDQWDKIQEWIQANHEFLMLYHDTNLSQIFSDHGDWLAYLSPPVMDDLVKKKSKNVKAYKSNSIRELLRAIRNLKAHYMQKDSSDLVKELGSTDEEFLGYWVSRFPWLIDVVWTSIQQFPYKLGLNKYYENIKYYFV